MVYTSNAIKHTIYSELDEVHRHMRQKYDLQKKAANDIEKAKEMEKYLRLFKTIGNMEADDTGLQSVLAQEGM